MRSRRALLYMPGDDIHKIGKATTLGVDCICMDMEDGVARNHKSEARAMIAEALHTLNFGDAEKLARINPVGSGLEEADLEQVLPAHPDGIVVPKVVGREQLAWVSQRLQAAETRYRWPIGSIRLLVLIETAPALINLASIASADDRLEALIFGADDFTSSIGATHTPEGAEILYARSAVVTHAAAFGLQALDRVVIDFKDSAWLQHDAEFGAQLGFSGKQIIHPNQVAPVQAAFTPTAEAVAAAERILQAAEQKQQLGVGAFAVDGKMIDAPVVKAAAGVLARAARKGR